MTTHTCARCTATNPWPKGSLKAEHYNMGVALHRLFWALAETLRLPRLVDWLARKLP
jgi:hypothetical protein